jgi:hypothetical protein
MSTKGPDQEHFFGHLQREICNLQEIISLCPYVFFGIPEPSFVIWLFTGTIFLQDKRATYKARDLSKRKSD